MPFENKKYPYKMRVGLDLRSCMNLTQYCNELDINFDFLMIDVCHALNFRDEKTIASRDIALTRSGKPPKESSANSHFQLNRDTPFCRHFNQV